MTGSGRACSMRSRAPFSPPARPLLLVIDDLQWCDGETLGWLHYLLRSQPRGAAARGGDAPALRSSAPSTRFSRCCSRRARAGRRSSSSSDHSTAPTRSRLAAQRLEARARGRAPGARLPRDRGQSAVRRRVDAAGFGRGRPTARRGRRGRALPPRAHSVIEARLAQLSPAAQELASLAATVGRAFTFDVLVRASSRSEERGGRGARRALGAPDRPRARRRRLRLQPRQAARGGLHARSGRHAGGCCTGASRRRSSACTRPTSTPSAASSPRTTSAPAGLSGRSTSTRARPRSSSACTRTSGRSSCSRRRSSCSTPSRRLAQRDERELALRTALGAPSVAIKGYGAPEVAICTSARSSSASASERRPIHPVLRALAIVHLARGELTARVRARRAAARARASARTTRWCGSRATTSSA